MRNQFTIKHFPSVTAVVHAMVLRAPSGLDPRTIAEIAGYKTYSTMMSEISRQPGHKLGADMLLPLMDAAGSDAPLTFLARERGGVFFKLNPVQAPQDKCMTLQLACTIKKTSEAAVTAASHIIDGIVSKEEFEIFKNEIDEAVTALLVLEKMMQDAVNE